VEQIVHVVHCIDTEGPLYEGLDVKFERLKNIFGITHLDPTQQNFDKICRGEIPLGGKEAVIQQTFSSHLTNYMDDWQKLDAMLARAMDDRFRMAVPDSFGGPFLYNWFCVDHVEYVSNPRRRAMGYLAIFDHFQALINKQKGYRDGLQWHMHPMSTYKEAHRCATSLLNSPHAWEGLARRVIDRHWFPSCFRAGFHVERPDLHWFLEQYVPFDYSNTSTEDEDEMESQADLANGRFGDWRLAPKDWGVYHPSRDNYQIPGDGRRWMARALNVLNRFANITPREVEKALQQAQEGKPTLLCIGSHDYRDLVPEVTHFRQLLVDAQKKFPNVKFKYGEAQQAFQAVAYQGKTGAPVRLDVRMERFSNGTPKALHIQTRQGKVFGPQPFLALKTKSQRYIHDNLDFGTDLHSWHYVFDAQSVLPDDLETVGVATCDAFGNVDVHVIPGYEPAAEKQPAGALR